MTASRLKRIILSAIAQIVLLAFSVTSVLPADAASLKDTLSARKKAGYQEAFNRELITAASLGSQGKLTPREAVLKARSILRSQGNQLVSTQLVGRSLGEGKRESKTPSSEALEIRKQNRSLEPAGLRLKKVAFGSLLAGVVFAVGCYLGGFDWYVEIKSFVTPGMLFYFPAAVLDIAVGVFIWGITDYLGQYLNDDRPIREKQVMILALAGVLQGLLTHILLNLPDRLPAISSHALIQGLFRTGVVLAGGFAISLYHSLATTAGRKLSGVEINKVEELKKTGDTMISKTLLSFVKTYIVINVLPSYLRYPVTMGWEYIMHVFASYLMNRVDSLFMPYFARFLPKKSMPSAEETVPISASSIQEGSQDNTEGKSLGGEEIIRTVNSIHYSRFNMERFDSVDFPRLMEIFEGKPRTNSSLLTITDRKIREVYRALAKKEYSFRALNSEDNVVGYVFADPSTKPKTIYISNIRVDKAWHENGVGTQLLKLVADTAKTKGQKFISLYVSEENFRAIRFYFNLGFRFSSKEADEDGFLRMAAPVSELIRNIENSGAATDETNAAKESELIAARSLGTKSEVAIVERRFETAEDFQHAVNRQVTNELQDRLQNIRSSVDLLASEFGRFQTFSRAEEFRLAFANSIVIPYRAAFENLDRILKVAQVDPVFLVDVDGKTQLEYLSDKFASIQKSLQELRNRVPQNGQEDQNYFRQARKAIENLRDRIWKFEQLIGSVLTQLDAVSTREGRSLGKHKKQKLVLPPEADQEPKGSRELEEAGRLISEMLKRSHYSQDEINLQYALQLAREIEKHPIEKILVVGISLPYFSALLGLTGKTVVYVDKDPAIIFSLMDEYQGLKKEAEANGVLKPKDIKTVTSEIGALDLAKQQLEPGSFDLVTFIDLVGEGAPIRGEPRLWLETAKKLLKPNGYLVIDESSSGDSIASHLKDVFPDASLVADSKYFQGSYNMNATNRLYQIAIGASLGENGESLQKLEKYFGKRSALLLLQNLLAIEKGDDYPFVMSEALEILRSINGNTNSPLDVLHAILSFKRQSFEKAYLYLYFMNSVSDKITEDQIRDQLGEFKQTVLIFLNKTLIRTNAQAALGHLLEQSPAVYRILLKQAQQGDRDALRIMALSPSLIGQAWRETDKTQREEMLSRIINLLLENVFSEVINQQAHLIASLTPGWDPKRPLDGAPKRPIDREFINKFLSDAGVKMSANDELKDLLNPEMFRVTKEGLIVTPIYMITRANRGGEYNDTPGAIDIARGLVPYTFAFGGMTRTYVGEPTIHEIDLVVMAKQMNTESVWKVQADFKPAIYTFTEEEIPVQAYSGSYRIDEQDWLTVYKRAAKIHYLERWHKQIIFSNLDELRSAKDPQKAREAILRIRDSIKELRNLYQTYKDRSEGYSTYYFRALPDELFESLLISAREGQIESAYRAIVDTETMKLLFLEAKNIRDTYEDYQLKIEPLKPGKGKGASLGAETAKRIGLAAVPIAGAVSLSYLFGDRYIAVCSTFLGSVIATSIVAGISRASGSFINQVVKGNKVNWTLVKRWAIVGMFYLGPVTFGLWYWFLKEFVDSTFMKVALDLTVYAILVSLPVNFLLQKYYVQRDKNPVDFKTFIGSFFRLYSYNTLYWGIGLYAGWSLLPEKIVLVAANLAMIWSGVFIHFLDRWLEQNKKAFEGRSTLSVASRAAALEKIYKDSYKERPEIGSMHFKRLEKGIFVASDITNSMKVIQYAKTLRPQAKTFLDFGSGDGRVAILASFFGFQTTGVEYSKPLADFAGEIKRRAADNGLIVSEQVKLDQGNAYDADFSHYDIIFIADTDGIDREKLQEKINREVKPDAIIIINHPKQSLEKLSPLKLGWLNKLRYSSVIGAAEGKAMFYQPVSGSRSHAKSLGASHVYSRVVGKEEDQILGQIKAEAEDGHISYAERFINAFKNSIFHPQFDLFLESYSAASNERIRHTALVRDENGIYWIIKSKKMVNDQPKNLPRREMLAYLLAEGRANVVPIRLLSETEAQTLKLSGSAQDHYLTRVVTTNNMKGAYPIAKPAAAFASIFVANVLFRKYDQHLFNVAFAGGASVSIDNDIVGHDPEVLSREVFLTYFMRHALIQLAQLSASLPGLLALSEDSKKLEDIQNERPKDELRFWKDQFIKAGGLGFAWRRAEMLNEENIAEAIRAFKEIRDIRTIALQAGYTEGSELDEIVSILESNLKTLGDDVDFIWRFLTNETSTFRLLDADKADRLFGQSLGAEGFSYSHFDMNRFDADFKGMAVFDEDSQAEKDEHALKERKEIYRKDAASEYSFIARDREEKPIAFVFAGLLDVKGAETVRVRKLQTQPQLQDQGIGTQLLNMVAEHAQSEGRSLLTLDVVDNNLHAQLFYQNLGFIFSDDADERDRYLPMEVPVKFLLQNIKRKNSEWQKRGASLGTDRFLAFAKQLKFKNEARGVDISGFQGDIDKILNERQSPDEMTLRDSKALRAEVLKLFQKYFSGDQIEIKHGWDELVYSKSERGIDSYDALAKAESKMLERLKDILGTDKPPVAQGKLFDSSTGLAQGKSLGAESLVGSALKQAVEIGRQAKEIKETSQRIEKLKELVKLFGHENLAIRQGTLRLLRDFGPEGREALLISLQEKNSDLIKQGAMLALGYLGKDEKEAVKDGIADGFRPFLEDQDPADRKSAYTALRYLGSVKAKKMLVATLGKQVQKKEYPEDYFSLIAEIALTQDPDYVYPILRHLDHYLEPHAGPAEGRAKQQEVQDSLFRTSLMLNSNWVADNLKYKTVLDLAKRYGYVDKGIHYQIYNGQFNEEKLKAAQTILRVIGMVTQELFNIYFNNKPEDRSKILDQWSQRTLELNKSLVSNDVIGNGSVKPITPLLISESTPLESKIDSLLLLAALRNADQGNIEAKLKASPFDQKQQKQAYGQFFYQDIAGFRDKTFKESLEKAKQTLALAEGHDTRLDAVLLPFMVMDEMALQSESRGAQRQETAGIFAAKWIALAKILQIQNGKLTFKTGYYPLINEVYVGNFPDREAPLGDLTVLARFVSALASPQYSQIWKYGLLDPFLVRDTNKFIRGISQDPQWTAITKGAQSALKLYAYDIFAQALSDQDREIKWREELGNIYQDEERNMGRAPSIGIELQSISIPNHKIYAWKETLKYFGIPSPPRVEYAQLVEASFEPTRSVKPYLLAIPLLAKMGFHETYKLSSGFHISIGGDLGDEAKFIAAPLLTFKTDTDEDTSSRPWHAKNASVMSKGLIYRNKGEKKEDLRTEFRVTVLQNTSQVSGRLNESYQKYLPGTSLLSAALFADQKQRSGEAVSEFEKQAAEVWRNYRKEIEALYSGTGEQTKKLLEADWYESTGDAVDPQLVKKLGVVESLFNYELYYLDKPELKAKLTQQAQEIFLRYSEQIGKLIEGKSLGSSQFPDRWVTLDKKLQFEDQLAKFKLKALSELITQFPNIKNFRLILEDGSKVDLIHPDTDLQFLKTQARGKTADLRIIGKWEDVERINSALTPFFYWDGRPLAWEIPEGSSLGKKTAPVPEDKGFQAVFYHKWRSQHDLDSKKQEIAENLPQMIYMIQNTSDLNFFGAISTAVIQMTLSPDYQKYFEKYYEFLINQLRTPKNSKNYSLKMTLVFCLTPAITKKYETLAIFKQEIEKARAETFESDEIDAANCYVSALLKGMGRMMDREEDLPSLYRVLEAGDDTAKAATWQIISGLPDDRRGGFSRIAYDVLASDLKEEKDVQPLIDSVAVRVYLLSDTDGTKAGQIWDLFIKRFTEGSWQRLQDLVLGALRAGKYGLFCRMMSGLIHEYTAKPSAFDGLENFLVSTATPLVIEALQNPEFDYRVREQAVRSWVSLVSFFEKTSMIRKKISMLVGFRASLKEITIPVPIPQTTRLLLEDLETQLSKIVGETSDAEVRLEVYRVLAVIRSQQKKTGASLGAAKAEMPSFLEIMRNEFKEKLNSGTPLKILDVGTGYNAEFVFKLKAVLDVNKVKAKVYAADPVLLVGDYERLADKVDITLARKSLEDLGNDKTLGEWRKFDLIFINAPNWNMTPERRDILKGLLAVGGLLIIQPHHSDGDLKIEIPLTLKKGKWIVQDLETPVPDLPSGEFAYTAPYLPPILAKLKAYPFAGNYAVGGASLGQTKAMEWLTKKRETRRLSDTFWQGVDELEKYRVLEKFINEHSFKDLISPRDGSIYWPSHMATLLTAFRELERQWGDLKGKRLLDFGAGDLRVSLMAAFLFGMRVTAVEKDPAIFKIAKKVLEDAIAAKFVEQGDITLIKGSALDQDWSKQDAIVFFYTEPPKEPEATHFRIAIRDKFMREANEKACFVGMFTFGQLAVHMNPFESVEGVEALNIPRQPSRIIDIKIYSKRAASLGKISGPTLSKFMISYAMLGIVGIGYQFARDGSFHPRIDEKATGKSLGQRSFVKKYDRVANEIEQIQRALRKLESKYLDLPYDWKNPVTLPDLKKYHEAFTRGFDIVSANLAEIVPGDDMIDFLRDGTASDYYFWIYEELRKSLDRPQEKGGRLFKRDIQIYFNKVYALTKAIEFHMEPFDPDTSLDSPFGEAQGRPSSGEPSAGKSLGAAVVSDSHKRKYRTPTEVSRDRSAIKQLLDQGPRTPTELSQLTGLPLRVVRYDLESALELKDHPNKVKEREPRSKEKKDADRAAIKRYLDQAPYTPAELSRLTGISVEIVRDDLKYGSELKDHPNRPERRQERTQEQRTLDRAELKKLLDEKPLTPRQLSELTKIPLETVWDDLRRASELRDHPNKMKSSDSGSTEKIDNKGVGELKGQSDRIRKYHRNYLLDLGLTGQWAALGGRYTLIAGRPTKMPDLEAADKEVSMIVRRAVGSMPLEQRKITGKILEVLDIEPETIDKESLSHLTGVSIPEIEGSFSSLSEILRKTYPDLVEDISGRSLGGTNVPDLDAEKTFRIISPIVISKLPELAAQYPKNTISVYRADMGEIGLRYAIDIQKEGVVSSSLLARFVGVSAITLMVYGPEASGAVEDIFEGLKLEGLAWEDPDLKKVNYANETFRLTNTANIGTKASMRIMEIAGAIKGILDVEISLVSDEKGQVPKASLSTPTSSIRGFTIKKDSLVTLLAEGRIKKDSLYQILLLMRCLLSDEKALASDPTNSHVLEYLTQISDWRKDLSKFKPLRLPNKWKTSARSLGKSVERDAMREFFKDMIPTFQNTKQFDITYPSAGPHSGLIIRRSEDKKEEINLNYETLSIIRHALEPTSQSMQYAFMTFSPEETRFNAFDSTSPKRELTYHYEGPNPLQGIALDSKGNICAVLESSFLAMYRDLVSRSKIDLPHLNALPAKLMTAEEARQTCSLIVFVPTAHGASLGAEATNVFGGGEFQIDNPLVKAGRILFVDDYKNINGVDLTQYAKTKGIKRIYFDLDLTVFRSMGYVSSSVWFENVLKEFGVEKTFRWWGNLGHEARQIQNGYFYRLMDLEIPQMIEELHKAKIEVVGLTARNSDYDESRTNEILKHLGVSLDRILFTAGPSKKGEVLDRYEAEKDGRLGAAPSLFVEDSFKNLDSMLGSRSHISGIYYHPPTANTEDEWDYREYMARAEEAWSKGERGYAFEYTMNAVVKILELDGITRETAYAELRKIHEKLRAMKDEKLAGYAELLQIVEIAKDGRSYLFHDDQARVQRSQAWSLYSEAKKGFAGVHGVNLDSIGTFLQSKGIPFQFKASGGVSSDAYNAKSIITAVLNDKSVLQFFYGVSAGTSHKEVFLPNQAALLVQITSTHNGNKLKLQEVLRDIKTKGPTGSPSTDSTSPPQASSRANSLGAKNKKVATKHEEDQRTVMLSDAQQEQALQQFIDVLNTEPSPIVIPMRDYDWLHMTAYTVSALSGQRFEVRISISRPERLLISIKHDENQSAFRLQSSDPRYPDVVTRLQNLALAQERAAKKAESSLDYEITSDDLDKIITQIMQMIDQLSDPALSHINDQAGWDKLVPSSSISEIKKELIGIREEQLKPALSFLNAARNNAQRVRAVQKALETLKGIHYPTHLFKSKYADTLVPQTQFIIQYLESRAVQARSLGATAPLSNPVTIMHVIPELIPAGAERLLLSVVARLDKKKYKSIVVCLSSADELKTEFEKLGIEVVTLGRKKYDPWTVADLARLMKERNVKLVHTHLCQADVYGQLAAKLAGVPVVISTKHNTDPFVRNSLSVGKWLDRLLTMNISSRVITVSGAVKDFFVKWQGLDPKRGTVIHNAIAMPDTNMLKPKDEVRKELGIKSDVPVIGVAARLTKQKGHRYLLEAMPAIIKQHPDVKLVLVGDGELKEELMGITRRLGIEKNVIFTGWRTDALSIINTFDIFVLPSLWEGFGIAVIEGMALNKPVVATAVDGPKEIVEDGKTGILVEPKDSAKLADAISRVLSDKDLAVRMGEAGRRRVVEEFSIDKMVGKMESVYDEELKKVPGLSVSGASLGSDEELADGVTDVFLKQCSWTRENFSSADVEAMNTLFKSRGLLPNASDITDPRKGMRVLVKDVSRGNTIVGAYAVQVTPSREKFKIWVNGPDGKIIARLEDRKVAHASGSFAINKNYGYDDPAGYGYQGVSLKFFRKIKDIYLRRGFGFIAGDSLMEAAFGFWRRAGGFDPSDLRSKIRFGDRIKVSERTGEMVPKYFDLKPHTSAATDEWIRQAISDHKDPVVKNEPANEAALVLYENLFSGEDFILTMERMIRLSGPDHAQVPIEILKYYAQDAELKEFLLKRLKDVENFAIETEHPEALSLLSNAAFKTFSEDLRKINARSVASKSLGEDGREPSFEKQINALNQSLKDPDSKKREEATDAIGRIGPPAVKAVPDIIRVLAVMVLRDENHFAREAAATALGNMGPEAKTAVTALLRRLSSEHNPFVKGAIIAALGKISTSEEAMRGLRQCLRDSNPYIRIEAANALARLGPSAASALQDLSEVLANPMLFADVRKAFENAVHQISPDLNVEAPEAQSIDQPRDLLLQSRSGKDTAIEGKSLGRKHGEFKVPLTSYFQLYHDVAKSLDRARREMPVGASPRSDDYKDAEYILLRIERQVTEFLNSPDAQKRSKFGDFERLSRRLNDTKWQLAYVNLKRGNAARRERSFEKAQGSYGRAAQFYLELLEIPFYGAFPNTHRHLGYVYKESAHNYSMQADAIFKSWHHSDPLDILDNAEQLYRQAREQFYNAKGSLERSLKLSQNAPTQYSVEGLRNDIRSVESAIEQVDISLAEVVQGRVDARSLGQGKRLSVKVPDDDSVKYAKTLNLFISSSNEKAVLKKKLEELLKRDARFARIVKQGTFLDVGAESGALTEVLAPFFDKGVALEINPFSAGWLRTRSGQFSKLSVVQDSLQNYSPSQQFDLILLSHMLYYLKPEEQEAQMARVMSWLKPEGRAIIILNSMDGPTGSVPHYLHEVGAFEAEVDQNAIIRAFIARGYEVKVERVLAHAETRSKSDMSRILGFFYGEPATILKSKMAQIQDYQQKYLWDPERKLYSLELPQDILYIERPAVGQSLGSSQAQEAVLPIKELSPVNGTVLRERPVPAVNELVRTILENIQPASNIRSPSEEFCGLVPISKLKQIDLRQIEFVLSNPLNRIILVWDVPAQTLAEKQAVLEKMGLSKFLAKKNFEYMSGFKGTDGNISLDAQVQKIVSSLLNRGISPDKIAFLKSDDMKGSVNVPSLKTSSPHSLFLLHYLVQINGDLTQDLLRIFKREGGDFIAQVSEEIEALFSNYRSDRKSAQAA